MPTRFVTHKSHVTASSSLQHTTTTTATATTTTAMATPTTAMATTMTKSASGGSRQRVSSPWYVFLFSRRVFFFSLYLF